MGSGSRKPSKLKSTQKALRQALKNASAWLIYIPLAAIVAVLRWLPLPWSFRLGWVTGWLLYFVLPQYRRLVRENLCGALGISPREAARLARQNFAMLGANAASSFKVPRLSPEEISRVAEIENLEELRSNIAKGRGVVLAINHLGNWELYAQLVYRVPEARFGTIYQPIHNPLVDRLVNSDRRRLGVQTFDRRKGFARALALLREPGIVGVLVDQNAGDAGLWVPFFGRLSSTSSLAETLALRTNAAVIPVAVQTVGTARWRVVLEREVAWEAGRPGQLTADLNCVLEQQIRRSPADWFWVHNRWKIPSPNFLTRRYKRGTFLPPGLSRQSLRPFRMVVRSPNWLGDACMAIDAARAFKQGRADAWLSILTPAKLAALWRTVPEVDEVIEVGRKESPWRVAAKLRKSRFDVAVLFTHSLRSALEVWLAGVPRRVGRPGHFRRWMLNQVFVPKKKKAEPPRHHAALYEEMAVWCGGDIPAPDAQNRAPRPSRSRPKVLICPGAEYGPAKRWPAERFREVMKRVDAVVACDWAVVGVASDVGVATEVCQGFDGQVENLAGKTSLEQLMALLQQADVLLSNDTGTMHLADRIGTPLLAIFGSTEPLLTGPRRHQSVVLRHKVECSPCFLRHCPLDFRCMLGVTPEKVATALLHLLQKPAPPIVASPEISKPPP